MNQTSSEFRLQDSENQNLIFITEVRNGQQKVRSEETTENIVSTDTTTEDDGKKITTTQTIVKTVVTKHLNTINNTTS